MPRSARIIPEEGYFHVITRGNNGQKVFREHEDYVRYLQLFAEVRRSHPFNLYHYCLMQNHVHLLLETVKGSALSVLMKKINLKYFFYYRQKYGYAGHFWQDRYKSLLIGKDAYLLVCAAYIELNPVRGGIVEEPGNYPYSSFNYYSRGQRCDLLKHNPLYVDFGVNEEQRRRGYAAYVIGQIGALDDYEKKWLTKRAVGSESFLDKIEQTFTTVISRRFRGRPKKNLCYDPKK